MKGKCPSCARIYEISDEFLSMGGSAKCPHCMEDLDFSAVAAEPPKRDPRTDQTRIDPRREAAPTRVEPGEVDARCASCNRRFKIDAEYLHLGGEARCPHCDLKLVFDVPQPAPPPKPPDEALWDDTTGQTVEVGEHRGLQSAAEDEPDAAGATDDPYAGTGEVSLPELSGELGLDGQAAAGFEQQPLLDRPADGEQEAGRGEEVAADLGEEDEADRPTEAEEADWSAEAEEADRPTEAEEADWSAEAEEADRPTAAEEEADWSTAAEEEADWSAAAEEEADWSAEAEEAKAEEQEDHLPTEVMDSPYRPDDPAALDDEMPTPDEEAGPADADERESLEGLSTALDEELDEDMEPAGALPFDTDEDAVDGAGEPAVATKDEEQPAAAEEQDEEEGGEEPEEETREVSVDWTPPPEAQQPAAEPADEDSGAASGEPAESGAPFGALADDEDWASAAAAWAESGFDTGAMPSFIKSEPPPPAEGESAAAGPEAAAAGAVERTAPGAVSGPAARSGLIDATDADSVEVSDADIIELDEADLDEPGEPDEPAAAASAEPAADSWAARASRELADKKPAAAALSRPARHAGLLARLSHPAVLAAVLGLAAVALIWGMWIWLGSSEDVAGVDFPAERVEAELVEAPPPRPYQGKEGALKHYGLGNRLAHQGQFEKALLEYQKASRLDPGYPLPHRAMGAVYAALGKPELSATAYDTYLNLEPRGPDADAVRALLKRYRQR